MMRRPAHDVVLEKLQKILKLIDEAWVLEDDLKMAFYAGQVGALLDVINEMIIPKDALSDFIERLRSIQALCVECGQQEAFFNTTQEKIEELIKEI